MKPVLRYLGGKYNYIKILEPYFPDNVKYYYEPFCGSAGVFCIMVDKYKMKKIYLNDIDENLVNFYKVIQNNTEMFIKSYIDLCKNNKDMQFEYCKNNIMNANSFEKALYYFFLKEHSFNSIITYYKNGNIRCYKSNTIHSIENLRKVYNVFTKNILNVNFSSMDFSNISIPKRKDTFVFIDPPYYIDYTNTFYNHSVIDHNLLKNYIDTLHKKNIKFMLTYNKCSYIENLYKDYKQIIIQKPARHLRGDKKGKIEEFVIINY